MLGSGVRTAPIGPCRKVWGFFLLYPPARPLPLPLRGRGVRAAAWM
jgi:hypothetical protein